LGSKNVAKLKSTIVATKVQQQQQQQWQQQQHSGLKRAWVNERVPTGREREKA
jgi:hypothetical protein